MIGQRYQQQQQQQQPAAQTFKHIQGYSDFSR
jgi:hypothetical protein